MKYWSLLLILGVTLASVPALAAGNPPLSPELQKLNISVGRWVFHGKALNARTGKSSPFTWNEDCTWSPNQLYLECTFSNNWAGKPIESLVVDTYNTEDHSYWHYEMYASGERGDRPFVSRMEIQGNTWIEHGQEAVPSKKQRGERVVYKWASPTEVSVAIQSSSDGVHWRTLDQGEGKKLP